MKEIPAVDLDAALNNQRLNSERSISETAYKMHSHNLCLSSAHEKIGV